MKKIRYSTVLGSVITFSLALLLSLTWAGLVCGQPIGVKDSKTTPAVKQTPARGVVRPLDASKKKLVLQKFDAMKKASTSGVSAKGCADGIADAGAGKAWLVAMGAPGGGWARVELSTPDISVTEDIKNVVVRAYGSIHPRKEGGLVKVQVGVKCGNEVVATFDFTSPGYGSFPYMPDGLRFDMKANKNYHAYVKISIDASTPDEVNSAVVSYISFKWTWTN